MTKKSPRGKIVKTKKYPPPKKKHPNYNMKNQDIFNLECGKTE